MSARAFVVCLPVLMMGCIPERDNLYDSSLRPNPVLQVRDATTESFGCLAVASVDTLPAVTATSRRACLLLDARGSGDPQQDALTFDYEAVAGGEVVATFATGTSAELVLVGSEELRSLPLGLVEFRVTAEDEGGSRSSFGVTVAFVNAPPVAVVNPERTLPLGGYPWAPGETCIFLEWDGSGSSDADEDSPTFTWAFPAEPGCDETTEASGERVTHGIDLAVPGRRLVQLIVGDGAASSDPVRGVVVVGPQPLWRNGLGGERFDPIERLDLVPADVALPDIAFGEGHIAAVWRVNASTLQVRIRHDDGSFDEVLTTGSGPAPRVAGGSSSEVFWQLSSDAGGTAVRRVDAQATVGPEILLPLEYEGNGPRSVDGSGRLWYSNGLLPATVARVDGAGNVLLQDPEEDHFVATLDARDGEVWAVYMPGFQTGAEPFLRRFTDGAEPTDHPLPPANGFATLRMLDGGEAWLALSGIGVHRVDLTALAEGLAYEDAVLQRVPDACCEVSAPDPVTGDVWASKGASTAIRIVRAGAVVTTTAFQQGTQLHGFNGDGRIVFRHPDLDGVVLGTSPDPRGVSSTTESIGFRTDAAEGGMWSTQGGTLTRVGSDGRRSRVIDRVLLEGSEEFLGSGTRSFASPDGRWLWTQSTEGTLSLFVFDLLEEVPTGHKVVDSPFEALQLVPVATAPLVWAIRPGQDKVFLIGTSAGSSFVEIPVFGAGEAAPTYAASPASGALCLATRRTSTDEAFFRRVALSGSAQTFGVVPIPAGSGTFPLAAAPHAPGPDVDLCFFSVSFRHPTDPSLNEWTIRGFDAGGTRVFAAGATGQGVITSIRPIAPDRAWVTLDRPTGPETTSTTTALVTSGGTLLFELPADPGTQFLIR